MCRGVPGGGVPSQGWGRARHAPNLSFLLLSVFPDPRPPEAREPFGEHGGKVALAQGIAWEKGKGSEVSVMLTVSAAAAKVGEAPCAGGAGRAGARFSPCGEPPASSRRALPLGSSGAGSCPGWGRSGVSDPALPLAPQNLNGVMVAVAELLRMRIPSSYEVLFPESPVRGSGPEAKKVETDGAGEYRAAWREEPCGQRVSPSPAGSQQWSHGVPSLS